MLVESEKAAAYTADDGSFALNVRATGRTDRDGKPQWQYSVFSDGALLTSGNDLHGWSDASGMLATLTSFLSADAETYRSHMGATQPDDGYSFGETVAEWAYVVDDELSSARWEIEDGDDEE